MIAQHFPPDRGGGATRAYNMTKGMVLSGCDLTEIAAFPHHPTGNILRHTDGNLAHALPDSFW